MTTAAIVITFVAGLVCGAFLTMSWAGAWVAGDALIDLLRAPGFDAHADQAIAITVELPPCPSCGERCDDCDERMCTEYGPEPAPTCDTHRLCTSCDDVSNTCSACSEARAIALMEASS